tara:strand:+ start:2016 stop:2372 length:357 start_codon:yes stop_codon:yes gene_type:complete
METKEQLVASIKGWISIDSEISKLQRQLKEKREEKKRLSNDLLTTMKANDIDCFDMTGGSLMYKRSVTKKPLTNKNISLLLEKYFNESSIKHEEVTKFLMDNREESVKEIVKHKIDKK